MCISLSSHAASTLLAVGICFLIWKVFPSLQLWDLVAVSGVVWPVLDRTCSVGLGKAVKNGWFGPVSLQFDEDANDEAITKCEKCAKPLGFRSLTRGTGMVARGEGLNQLMEHKSFACKSCGKPFCMQCMSRLKTCPACRRLTGW